MAALSGWWRAAVSEERESPARWRKGTWYEPSSHNLLESPVTEKGTGRCTLRPVGNPPSSHWSKTGGCKLWVTSFVLVFVLWDTLAYLARVYCKTLVHGILEIRTWEISSIKSIQMQIQALSAALHHTLLPAAVQLSEQAQQQANNFMYRSRPAEFKGAGHRYVNVCRIRILRIAWNLAWLSAFL